MVAIKYAFHYLTQKSVKRIVFGQGSHNILSIWKDCYFTIPQNVAFCECYKYSMLYSIKKKGFIVFHHVSMHNRVVKRNPSCMLDINKI